MIRYIDQYITYLDTVTSVLKKDDIQHNELIIISTLYHFIYKLIYLNT